MKREIKFRVFTDGEMFYPVGDEWAINLEGDSLGYNVGGLEYRGGDDDEIIMQYTGLKDLSGTDIYEGDIIDTFPLIKSSEIYEVKYGVAKNLSDTQTHYVGFYLESKLKKISLSPGLSGDYKVIGNIYENSDLLI